MSERVLYSMTGKVPVTPGQLTGPVRAALASGHCHSLAVALHEHTGWEVVGRVDEHDRLDHVAVLTPEGRLLDSTGCAAFTGDGWETLYPATDGGPCDRSLMADLPLDWPFDLAPDWLWELDLVLPVLEQRQQTAGGEDRQRVEPATAAASEPGGEPAALPLCRIDRVAHIGTLDPADKGNLTWTHSYEGHGLSVSLDPDDWERIAQLGGLPWWELTNPDGVFLDALALGDGQCQAVLDWGMRQRLCELRDVWLVARYDDELEDIMLTCFDSQAEAREEAELMELDADAVRRERRPRATAALRERIGCDSGPDCFEQLLALWTQNTQPQLDGVWWRYRHGPLSAPAGTILPDRLGRWQRRPIRRGTFDAGV